MTFGKSGFRGMAAKFKKSLGLPVSASCPVCGFFDIWDKDVRSILTEAGYSIEAAMRIECQCGGDTGRQRKKDEEKKVRDTYRAAGGRISFAEGHSQGFKDEGKDQRKWGRRND